MNSPRILRNCGARLILVALLGTIGGSPALSAAVTWHNVQIGGFFSQGYLESSNRNNYPVETQDGTLDFREYGLNASSTFGNHVRVAAQVFAQALGKYGEDKPYLDWAIVDYNVRPEFGVQVGRLKNPRSLYSDVLDLDMLRPFVLLPQSVYEARLRDFQASFDGGMIYGTVAAGQHSLDYKLYAGDLPIKTGSFTADFFNSSMLFANPPGVARLAVDSLYGASLTWNPAVPGLRVLMNYSRMENLSGRGPFVAMPMLPASTTLDCSETIGLGIEYAQGLWTFAGEYLYNSSDLTVTTPVPIPLPAQGGYGSRNYYLSAARRLGTKFELGAYYSETRDLYPLAGSRPDHRYRRDWTVALRYDLNDHLLFKVEVHQIEGTKDMFDLPEIPNPATRMEHSMMLFAAKTTLTF